jgi:N utilization substance protein B
MAESAAFPSIAPKIIMNEYVEISKYYSTPESKAFVNGLLDKLINKTK